MKKTDQLVALAKAVLGIVTVLVIIAGLLSSPIIASAAPRTGGIGNVHINWRFSQTYENIDACNVTFDHAIPEGIQIICKLAGHDDNLTDGVLNAPAFGLGNVMANGESSYTVPVLCYPNGDADLAQACSTEDISGVQIIFVQMETTGLS